MSLAKVSAILWRERELLELLLFKLEEEQLVLASGRTRWLGRASGEVEIFLDEIRKVELIRAVEVAATGRAMGQDGDLSLTRLAELSDQPWQDLLLDHRAAFLTLADEIHAMATRNRELLTAGQQAARDGLLGFGEGVSVRVDVSAARSDAGARINRVQSVPTSADTLVATLGTRLSAVEDIDVFKTVVELQLQQNAYQAALGAPSKVLNQSLADFLR